MKKNRRIIFKNSEGEVTITSLSVDGGWDLVEMVRADPDNQIPYELHFKSYKEDVEVVYVEDPISECSYAIVSGEDMDATCLLIEEKTECWTAEEMFSDWEKAPHDTAQILAILRIGVGAPYEYDERFANKLKEGLASDDNQVREATLAAIGYRDWQEFDSLLEDVAANDPDERCRTRAAVMLEIRERERAGN